HGAHARGDAILLVGALAGDGKHPRGLVDGDEARGGAEDGDVADAGEWVHGGSGESTDGAGMKTARRGDGRSGNALFAPAAPDAISASRTGTACGRRPGRTSSARPRGGRG